MEQEENQTNIKTDELSWVLDRTTAWIENCDTKTSIILSGVGVVFGILLATDYVRKIIEIIKTIMSNIGFLYSVFLLFFFLALSSIVAGIVFLLLVLIGKTDTKGLAERGINGKSIIFFSSISQFKNLQEYKNQLKRYSTKDFVDDISAQIYTCSIICDKKFSNYKKGLLLTCSGFGLSAIMIMLGVLVT